MELLLQRELLEKTRTLGSLYIDTVFECYTLEDPVREGPKIPGETAIPAGRYLVTLEPAATLWSPRDKKLPKLQGVPGFTDIYLHAGNTPLDTKGCILVGRTRIQTGLAFSRVALAALMQKLTYPTYITITED